MKTKTKRSWAHAYVCVCHVNTTIERRRVAVSVGQSVGTCMLALFFFPRALCREIILLPTYNTVRTR